MSILKVQQLQHTNGTNAMTIATSGATAFGGAVTNSNQPCWRLDGYSGSTLIPPVNNSTPHTFANVDFSQGCSATTSRVTISTAGKYLVGVRFIVGNPSANTETRYMNTNIRKNSTYIARQLSALVAVADGWGSGNSYHPTSCETIVDLAASDYLEVVLSRSSSSDWDGTIYEDSSNGFTQFFGYLIG